MQQPTAACTRAQSLTKPSPSATCYCLLQLVPYINGLDPLQLALVVFILPTITTKTSLAPAVVITCNLHWWCFSWYQLAHLRNNVHTWLAMHAVIANCYSHWWWWWWWYWWWWWWWLYVIYYYIIPENGSSYHHLLRQTSWWQRDLEMVSAHANFCGRPHGDRQDRKWFMLSPSVEADLMVTGMTRKWSVVPSSAKAHLIVTERSRKWYMLSPSTEGDLILTERPENGPRYHCLLRQTSWWQKD